MISAATETRGRWEGVGRQASGYHPFRDPHIRVSEDGEEGMGWGKIKRTLGLPWAMARTGADRHIPGRGGRYLECAVGGINDHPSGGAYTQMVV